MTKRVLLMYITEVSGHHSATIAIEKALKQLSGGIGVRNLNAFNYTNPVSEKIINRLYIMVIKRTPKLWHYLYDNPKVVKGLAKIKDAVHKFNSPKLKKLLDEFRPDVIVCTQAFPCGMVADFKKEYASDIPLIAVLTDYIPHSYWVYDQVDCYITPSEEVSKKLAAKGVSVDKIKPLGIPIDPKFRDKSSRMQVAASIGLDPKLFTILIMGGGQGLGPIKSIVRELESLPYELQEIIVCGSNKKLYNSLKKKIRKCKKKIALLGYANNINELMDSSDILITKPGGITTAEAMAKKIPMIIIRPIPGQEASNTSYLISEKAALKAEKASEVKFLIKDLIENGHKLKNLSASASRIGKPASSLDIAKFILDL